MTRIKLKDLDLDKMKRWVISARDMRGQDEVYSFMCAWIAFNYYYGMVTTENDKRIRKTYGVPDNKLIPDSDQIHFLLNHTVFPKLVDEYQLESIKELEQLERATDQGDVDEALRVRKEELAQIIELPINNVSTKRDHPRSRTTDTRIIDLTPDELIDTIYTIRNNLFHGGKDPKWVPRDLRLCKQANTFLVPFVEYLWNNATEALAD